MEQRIKVRCINTKTGASKRMNLKVAQSRKAIKDGWVIQDPNYEPVKVSIEKMESRPSCSAPGICEEKVDEVVNEEVVEEKEGVVEEAKPSPYDSMTKAELMAELDEEKIPYSRAERKEVLLNKLKG